MRRFELLHTNCQDLRDVKNLLLDVAAREIYSMYLTQPLADYKRINVELARYRETTSKLERELSISAENKEERKMAEELACFAKFLSQAEAEFREAKGKGYMEHRDRIVNEIQKRISQLTKGAEGSLYARENALSDYIENWKKAYCHIKKLLRKNGI